MSDVNKQIVLPRKLSNKALTETPASAIEKGQQLLKDTYEVLNQEIKTLRDSGRSAEAIRKLVSMEGTTSTSVFSFVEVAHTPFKVTAWNTADHSLSTEGIQLAKSVLASMDTLYDYSIGYGDKPTISSVIETSLLDVVTSSACAMELVLDKQRLPDSIRVVPYDTLTYLSRGDGTKYPAQESAKGDPIELDFPTFFVAELHKFSNDAYVRPMLEPALNSAFFFGSFLEDMWKAVRQSGHTRTTASIDAEMVRAAAPEEIKSDPKKLQGWMETVRKDVEKVLQGISPEEAFVSFNAVKLEQLASKGTKADYVPLMNAVSGSLATSLKSHPSTLGLRLEGSQSLSNTESLLFLKVANSIRKPVEQCLSRLLTLACRLYGADVYVKLEFDPINLRPEDELAAFHIMKKDMVKDLLSMGFISDDKAALMLGTGVRPQGAPELSGTMFMEGSQGVNASDASPNADPMGRALQPDTPTKNKGDSSK